VGINFIRKTRQALSSGELAFTSHGLKKGGIGFPWQVPASLALAFSISFLQSWTALVSSLALVLLLCLLLRVAWDKLLARAGLLGLFTFLLFLPSLFWGTDIWQVLFLACRSFLIIACALLLVLSLGWHGVLFALRKLKVPSLVLTLLDLSTRFIMLLFKVARESWEGAESRAINLKGKEGRRVVAYLFSSLFIKTLQFTEEVHEAMLARGYADF